MQLVGYLSEYFPGSLCRYSVSFFIFIFDSNALPPRICTANGACLFYH